jgi:hypothetical protein
MSAAVDEPPSTNHVATSWLDARQQQSHSSTASCIEEQCRRQRQSSPGMQLAVAPPPTMHRWPVGHIRLSQGRTHCAV